MRDLAPLTAHEGCGGCLGGRVREDGPGVTVYSLPFPLNHLKTDLFHFTVTVVHFILSLCPVSLPRPSRMPAFFLILSLTVCLCFALLNILLPPSYSHSVEVMCIKASINCLWLY